MRRRDEHSEGARHAREPMELLGRRREPGWARAQSNEEDGMADTIITNARVTTLDRANPEGQAVAVRDSLIQAVGPRDEIMRLADRRTRVIDAGGRRAELSDERYRDGAHDWGVYQDAADPSVWIEWFFLPSWAEHLRQHERATKHDQDIHARTRTFHRGAEPPEVSHFLAPLHSMQIGSKTKGGAA